MITIRNRVNSINEYIITALDIELFVKSNKWLAAQGRSQAGPQQLIDPSQDDLSGR